MPSVIDSPIEGTDTVTSASWVAELRKARTAPGSAASVQVAAARDAALPPARGMLEKQATGGWEEQSSAAG